MFLGSCPTDSEGVPKSRMVRGVGEGQFLSKDHNPSLGSTKGKKKHPILLSKGSVRQFNKILVKFVLFYEGRGNGCQPCR